DGAREPSRFHANALANTPPKNGAFDKTAFRTGEIGRVSAREVESQGRGRGIAPRHAKSGGGGFEVSYLSRQEGVNGPKTPNPSSARLTSRAAAGLPASRAPACNTKTLARQTHRAA